MRTKIKKHKQKERSSNTRKGKKEKIHEYGRTLKGRGCIIIRNLPSTVTDGKLKDHFCKFGTIKRVNLLRQLDGTPVGRALIEYNAEQNARQAIEASSGSDFMGRTITAAFIGPQSQGIQNQVDAGPVVAREENQSIEERGNVTVENGHPDIKEEKVEIKEEPESSYIDMPAVNADKSIEDVQQNSHVKKAKSLKKGRIIVRNISFKATETDLKQHFSHFGELNEVTLLRKPDGKLVGCGFVQFADKQNAAKAIVECSGKDFLGRPIVLDWAVSKTAYTKMNTPDTPEVKVQVKEEPVSDDDCPNADGNDVKFDPNTVVKSEQDSDIEKDDTDTKKEEAMDEDDEEEDSDEEDEDIENVDKAKNLKDSRSHSINQLKKFVSHDVSEGRTVFVKNIPFSANNTDFRKCMEQFGEVDYALICYDRLTEHSKGTGFVKYKTQESAQTCLSAGTELTLQGQVLDCLKALDKEELKSSDEKQLQPSKDSRNLYLVKEGVVLAGSKAAENVSLTDMAKRLQLEQLKTQMLRNLNMFVSPTRLVIHNLPPSYEDGQLFQLFKKHSGPKSFITESKVMRDMVNVDEFGVGKSKEMGFVSFQKHSDALTALRNINNHPEIFSVSKRPIVSFAIENRMVYKVRQQREQRSRDKNPLVKMPEEGESSKTASNRKNIKRRLRRLKLKMYRTPITVQNEKQSSSATISNKSNKKKKRRKQASEKETSSTKIQEREYTGVAAEPGNTKFRTKFNLKTQATLHMQTVRKDKKKKKSNKLLKIQKERIRQPKQKKGKGKRDMTAREEKSFSELVNKYKSKMAVPLKQKKWYAPDE